MEMYSLEKKLLSQADRMENQTVLFLRCMKLKLTVTWKIIEMEFYKNIVVVFLCKLNI